MSLVAVIETIPGGGRTAVVATDLVAETVTPWFVDPPANVVDAIDLLQKALNSGMGPLEGLASYLGLEVIEEPVYRADRGQLSYDQAQAIRLVVAAHFDVCIAGQPAHPEGCTDLELFSPEEAGTRWPGSSGDAGWMLRWLDGPDGWTYDLESGAVTLPAPVQVEAVGGLGVILRPPPPGSPWAPRVTRSAR